MNKYAAEKEVRYFAEEIRDDEGAVSEAERKAQKLKQDLQIAERDVPKKKLKLEGDKRNLEKFQNEVAQIKAKEKAAGTRR